MSRPDPPLWFLALLAVAFAFAARALDAASWPAGISGDGAPPIAYGFIAWLVTIGKLIWEGIQVAGQVTLAILNYSVGVLWQFAKMVWSLAKDLGGAFLKGMRESWEFLRATYEHVLKPAWQKLWEWFDRLRGWLDRVFKPVLEFLERVRTWLTEFYKNWVRPVLDTIDVARKYLRVLASLGLDWAKALDARLAELQRRVAEPFLLALAKINEIITWVDRVITFDGLLQRVALIRSIERDITYVQNLWWNATHRDATEEERAKAGQPPIEITPQDHIEEARLLIRYDTGELAGRVAEELTDLRLILRGS